MPRGSVELTREMESLKTGLKGLAVDAHRENYARLMEKLDEGLLDVENLKHEFSNFIAEVRSNREAIEQMRMDIAALRGHAGGAVPESMGSTDVALITRDIETLKTRIRWLESKATLPNIENLRARVEALENQIGGLRVSVPTVIE